MADLPRRLIEQPVPQDRAALRTSQKTNGRAKMARSVTVNLHESPLSWLKARGLVSPRQFAAGEQLRTDYERATLGPRVTMTWDAAPISRAARGALDPGRATTNQLGAKARFDAALAEVGSGLTDILWRVICAGEALPVAEKALSWPARSGRLVLGLALDRLATYYRIG